MAQQYLPGQRWISDSEAELGLGTILAEDGRLRPAAELAERFDAVGVDDATPVAVYCGSGITAAHAVLTLAVAGRPGVALYPGSWSAWIQDPDNPVATGPEPGGR